MRKHFAWIVIALIMTGPLFFYLESNGVLLGNTQKESFLIGKWILQQHFSPAQFSIYELEFVDSDTLICNTSDNGQNTYNIQFQYVFIGENRIKITAPRRLSSEWEILTEGDELVIKSSTWPEGVGVFKKSTVMNWSSVAIWLSLCVIGTFLITIPRTKTKNGELSVANIGQYQSAGLSRYTIYNLMALAFFISGLFGGMLIWSFPPLLRVRLPWDAVITLELGAILVILGIRTILANHRVFMEARTISWIYLLGIFLLGAGALGMIIGSGRLFIFIETGFYP